jgi:hypothetical protein
MSIERRRPADPTGLTARARPKARPDKRAAKSLSSYRESLNRSYSDLGGNDDR